MRGFRGLPRSVPYRGMRRSLRGWLACALFVLGGCGAASPRASLEPSNAGPLFRAYDAAAFEEAARTGRPLFVDVGIEGCTQCRRLHEITLADPRVQAALREHFVAVSVDAEVLPDIGGRYEALGWPALVFLGPDGTELGVVQGYRAPDVFLRILEEARSGRLEASHTARLSEPGDVELAALCHAASARLATLTDVSRGGFGSGFRVVHYEPVEWLFSRADPSLRAASLRTVDGYARLLDPVWGGVFVAAREPDFSGPIVEKRTANEAWALASFTLAYLRTRDARYEHDAREVLRYLHDFLRGSDGLYATTQDDAAPHLPEGMSASAYYELGDAERRAHGVPPIDHAAYTADNALVLSALVGLYEATGDATLLDEARALEAALRARVDRSGWIAQTADAPSPEMDAEGRLRAFVPEHRPFTRAQGEMGRAWLALHRATGEARYLDAARAVADVLVTRLEDLELGGFLPAEPRAGDPVRAEPVYWENLVAARFLAELAARLHDEDAASRYRPSIERAIRRVAGSPEAIARDGTRLALLVQTLEATLSGPLEITVVASEGVDASALLAAARAIEDPRRVVLHEPPGRYPGDAMPLAYVCTALACSSPVSDPAALAPVVAEAASALGDPCAP